jgi:hypothetical protein
VGWCLYWITSELQSFVIPFLVSVSTDIHPDPLKSCECDEI